MAGSTPALLLLLLAASAAASTVQFTVPNRLQSGIRRWDAIRHEWRFSPRDVLPTDSFPCSPDRFVLYGYELNGSHYRIYRQIAVGTPRPHPIPKPPIPMSWWLDRDTVRLRFDYPVRYVCVVQVAHTTPKGRFWSFARICTLGVH